MQKTEKKKTHHKTTIKNLSVYVLIRRIKSQVLGECIQKFWQLLLVKQKRMKKIVERFLNKAIPEALPSLQSYEE